MEKISLQYETMTDDELVSRAQNQDSQAMDYLMRKYKSVVRRKARSLFMIGGDQDDLTQEGMIGLYKAIVNYKKEAEAVFSTFAELCISRQMYSAIKMSNRMKNYPLNTYISIYMKSDSKDNEDSFWLDRTVASLGMNPEEILINKENIESRQKELYGRLSAMEKKVFDRYMTGMTITEIAGEMDISIKSVDNAMQRIKSKVSKEKK